MNIKIKTLFFLLIAVPIVYHSQSKQLHFSANYTGQTIKPDSIINITSETKITHFRFYVSSLELLLNKKVVYRERKSSHLIDVFDSTRNEFGVKYTGEIDAVRFYLGVDSLTNVSGALGGDLDPMHGMYWTWQSGYINFKLEGTSNQSPARLNEFQLHLGGYSFPYNGLQQVEIAVKPCSDIKITFNLDTFLSQINMSETHHIMSPSYIATALAKVAASCFTAKENEN